jgi:hypothetical protein
VAVLIRRGPLRKRMWVREARLPSWRQYRDQETRKLASVIGVCGIKAGVFPLAGHPPAPMAVHVPMGPGRVAVFREDLFPAHCYVPIDKGRE